MAGIIDLLTGNAGDLSPAERKALATKALSGEYLPKEGAVTPRGTPAGLLGADPVSIQGQPAPGVEGGQARLGQPQGRLPGGQGTYMGPETGVQPQGPRPGIGQAPIEGEFTRGPTGGGGGGRLPPGGGQAGIGGPETPRLSGPGAAAEVAEAGSKGMLGRIAGILGGPISMGVQAATYSPELGNGELTDAQRAPQMEADIPDAAKYAQHIRQLSKDTMHQTAGTQAPVLPTPDGQAPQAPQNIQATQGTGQLPSPQQQAQQAHAQQVQADTKRQTIEAGALKGLQTGAVSRPELAQTIVQQKAQQEGKPLTPDAQKAAVTEELATMKTMDNNSLSKYVGYAIMAAGLVAAVTDKTGRTGEAAFNAFDNQIQRQAAQRQQQAALAYQRFKDDRQYGLDNRKVGTDETKVANEDKYNTGKLANDSRDTDVKQQLGLLDVSAKREANSVAAGGNAVQQQLGLLAHSDRQAGLLNDKAIADQRAAVDLSNAKTRADAEKLTAKAAMGNVVTVKDATDIVDKVSTDPSIRVALSPGVKAAMGARLSNDLKLNPSADPIQLVKGYMDTTLNKDKDGKVIKGDIGMVWDTYAPLKKPKQQ